MHSTRGDALEERSAVHPRRDEPRSKRRRDGALDERRMMTRAEIRRRRRLNPSVGVVAGHPQRRLDATDQRVDVGVPLLGTPLGTHLGTPLGTHLGTHLARLRVHERERRVSHGGERELRRRRPLLPVQAQQALARLAPVVGGVEDLAEEAPAGTVRKPVRGGLGAPSAALERVSPPPGDLLVRPTVRPLEDGHDDGAPVVVGAVAAEQRAVGHGLHAQAAASVGKTRAVVQERLRRRGRGRERGGGGRLMGRKRFAQLGHGSEADAGALLGARPGFSGRGRRPRRGGASLPRGRRGSGAHRPRRRGGDPRSSVAQARRPSSRRVASRGRGGGCRPQIRLPDRFDIGLEAGEVRDGLARLLVAHRARPLRRELAPCGKKPTTENGPTGAVQPAEKVCRRSSQRWRRWRGGHYARRRGAADVPSGRARRPRDRSRFSDRPRPAESLSRQGKGPRRQEVSRKAHLR